MLAITDKLGQVHLFYPGTTPTHFIRFYDGTWSMQETGILDMPSSVSIYDGTIHAVGYGGYFRWTPEQGWFTPPSSQGFGSALSVDNQGILHTADQTGYRTLERSKDTGYASLSQRVSIPADMHKPTLSFIARWRGGSAQGSSTYNVTITDEITNTSVFTGPATHSWEHSWIPLDGWIGKEITVTFTIHQADGEPMVYLDLDDISIGSWLTPVIETIIPSEIHDPSLSQTITITGENFIKTPAIFVDQVPVNSANVTWINEFTIKLVLPQNILPGFHDLKVVNPGGQASLLAGAIRIGYFSILPLITH